MSSSIPFAPGLSSGAPSRGLFYLLLMLPIAVFTALATSPDSTPRAVIAASVVFPAIILAATKSSYLLDYFLVVVTFNRDLRRIMDWLAREYDPKPFMSVTPMAIACLMLAVALSRYSSWPRELKRGASFIGVGLLYSLCIGFNYKLGAVYGLMEYLLPLSVLVFCISVRPNEQTMTRWLRTLVSLGVVAAVYGAIQWSLVPPWDRSWIMWSNMYTSMGLPEPFKISIASTLESRGPAAWFMANGSIVMIASSKWRKPWGLVGAAFVCGVLLLTTVRSSWGYVVGAVLIFSVLQRGRSNRQLWVLGAAIAIMVICIPYLPESELIRKRISTLSTIQQDSSFQGRIGIAQRGSLTVLGNPFGFGMGSSGNGRRLVDGGGEGIGDNGYLSLLSDLGLPGFLLFIWGIGAVVVPVWRRHRAGDAPVAATLGLAMLGSSLLFAIIFNTLTSAHASYMWIAIASAFALPRQARQFVPARTSISVSHQLVPGAHR